MKTTIPLLLTLSLLAAAASCSDGKVQKFEEPPPPDPRCGDESRNGDEKCEGKDLGGASCTSLGYASGTLGCASDCTFDTSHCRLTCGNGRVDLGEECEGKDLKGERCAEWGTFSCGEDCRLLKAGCAPQPFKEVQRLTFLSGTFAAFGAGLDSGRAVGQLFVTQPKGSRIDLLPYDKDKLFDDARKRTLQLDAPALPPTVRDLNKDGKADAIIRYLGDQKLTFKLSGATAFSESTLALGCELPLEPMVADVDGDGDLDLVIPACSTDQATVSKVMVAKNDGKGAFTLGAPLALPEPTSFLRLANAKLYVQVPSTRSVKEYASDGAGGFTDKGARPLAPGDVPGDFVALELNDDDQGGTDLLAISADGSELAAFIAKGDGTFTRKPVASGLTAARTLTPNDLDLDGVPEVGLFSGTDVLFVKVSKNDFLVKKQALPHGITPLTLDFGDADLDGDADVAVSGLAGAAGQVVLFRNLVK